MKLTFTNFLDKFKKESAPNLDVLQTQVETTEEAIGTLETDITKKEEEKKLFSEDVQVEEEKFLKTKEEYLKMKEKFEKEEKNLREKKKEEAKMQKEINKLKLDKNKKILEHAEKVQELNECLNRLEQIRKMVVGGVEAEIDFDNIAEEIINKIDLVYSFSQTTTLSEENSNLGEIYLNDGILTYKCYSRKNGEVDKTYLFETSYVEEGRKLEIYRQGKKIELIGSGTNKIAYAKNVKEEEIEFIEKFSMRALTVLHNQYIEEKEEMKVG